MQDDATEVELEHIPGSNGPPLINHTFAYLRDPWGFDDAMAREFGVLGRMRILGRTIIHAASVELASEVLIDRERCYSNQFGWGHILGELFPGGLMLRDFDDHHQHRKILKVAFTREARQGYQRGINQAFARTLDAWAREPTLSFYPAIKRALLEQAAQVFLGLAPGRHAEQLLRWFAGLIAASIAVVRRPWPGTTWRRGLRCRAELDAFLRAEIPGRRGTDNQDLLTALCNATDPETGARLDDDQIVDHMIFLLFAAHDTTASALTTLLDELTAAPQLLARVCEECRSVEPELEGGLGWEQLDAVPELERALREALRVNPPVPYLLRRTVRPTTLGGHALPARAPVTVTVRAIHDDPQLWTEPARFDPDRFAPDRGEDRHHRHAYVPFGAGAHRCIGADLALQQAKSFGHQLLRRFDIERICVVPTRWHRIPLPRPVDDLPLRLSPR
jgi:cytochrome P450